MKRGRLMAFVSVMAAMALAGCASSPSPPLRYYQLRLDPPAGEGSLSRTASPDAAVWQVMAVRLPDYLDRDALWQAVGTSALQPMDGHRWAEPLRSTVPRVLAHDLGVLRGTDRVWTGNVPAGITVARQLRVEILEFAPVADGRTVRLRARWTVTDPSGAVPAQVAEAEVESASAGRGPDELVAAHRLALWRLAQRLVQPSSTTASVR